ncbi:putative Ras interacting protein RIPA [Bacillus phage JBP901]|uniref:Putative Ras interacting protein RIPA n=1 Tax=Bacillus phage JBP901 TaxID=1498212 RepID=A0A0E3DF05_9CAUD|nr:putative Ras interacting protein RIPA [Bacillus phage JBP901]AID17914.1 putative Ras interacting protein RIPA [Bacillus phage JBP901]
MSTFLWILSGTALVGATILFWGRYEYLKQKRISEELDRERAELEQKLIDEEKERVRLEQQRQATNATIQGQGIKKAILIEKAEPVEIVYPMSRAQAAPTMKTSPAPVQRRTSTSVSSTPKVKSTPKTTSRSTSRRDDDDYYNNSTVLGSSWGSYSSNNDSSSWGSSSSNSSCDSSSSSWGSDSSSSSSSSSDSGSWCD